MFGGKGGVSRYVKGGGWYVGYVSWVSRVVFVSSMISSLNIRRGVRIGGCDWHGLALTTSTNRTGPAYLSSIKSE